MIDITSFEAMAKLRLTEDERGWAEKIFADLETRFGALAEIDTEGVEPLVSVLDMENVFREDIASQLVPREELLARAHETYDGYFEVPKTLD